MIGFVKSFFFCFPTKQKAKIVSFDSIDEEKKQKKSCYDNKLRYKETLHSSPEQERKNFSINTRREHKFERLLLQLNITKH
jgi:hypothetical protein